jgi:hypothetical protein
MKFVRSKEWWLRLVDSEPDVPIAAGVPDPIADGSLANIAREGEGLGHGGLNNPEGRHDHG